VGTDDQLGWCGRSRIESGLLHSLYVVSVPLDAVVTVVAVPTVVILMLLGVPVGH